MRNLGAAAGAIVTGFFSIVATAIGAVKKKRSDDE